MKNPAAILLSFVLAPCWLLAPALAQWSLSTVQDGVLTPVVNNVFNFGSVAVGDSQDVVFRLTNNTAGGTYLTSLSILPPNLGFGFTNRPALPLLVNSGGANDPVCGSQLPNGIAYCDFTIHFQPFQVAPTYSANLQINQTSGLSIVLLGTGVPGLTVLLNNQPLAAGQTISFPDNVQVGSSAILKLALVNQTAAALAVPAVTVQGSFTLGNSPTGTSVAAGASAELDLVLAPVAPGPQTGTLTVGLLTFPITGMAVAAPPPVLPQPEVQVSLPNAASGQQGSLTVTLPTPAPVDASGSVALDFQPSMTGMPNDPAIAFADFTRTASFTVAKGSTTAQFSAGTAAAFQTGSTAGTLTFTATFGSNTAQATATIPGAQIGIGAAVAARNVGCSVTAPYCTAVNVQLEVNGWDNTRTASQVVFRFFDKSGAEIGSDITWDGSTSFHDYFISSTEGGTFELNALFPITGNADLVTGAEVQFTNSMGTTQTTKINF